MPTFTGSERLPNGWLRLGRFYYPPYSQPGLVGGGCVEVVQDMDTNEIEYVALAPFPWGPQKGRSMRFTDLENAMAHVLMLKAMGQT